MLRLFRWGLGGKTRITVRYGTVPYGTDCPGYIPVRGYRKWYSTGRLMSSLELLTRNLTRVWVDPATQKGRRARDSLIGINISLSYSRAQERDDHPGSLLHLWEGSLCSLDSRIIDTLERFSNRNRNI